MSCLISFRFSIRQTVEKCLKQTRLIHIRQTFLKEAVSYLFTYLDKTLLKGKMHYRFAGEGREMKAAVWIGHFILFFKKRLYSHPTYKQLLASPSQKLKQHINIKTKHTKMLKATEIWGQDKFLMCRNLTLFQDLGGTDQIFKALWKARQEEACWASGVKMFHRGGAAIEKSMLPTSHQNIIFIY